MAAENLNRWSIPLILVVLTLFFGCGSVGGVDGDTHLGIEIQARDAGDAREGGTLTIDVVRHCCRARGDEGEVTTEPFGDTAGLATFRYLGADDTGFTYRFDHYTVDYIPLTSPDGEGGTFIPPDLQSLDRRIAKTIVLTGNFTEAQRTIMLIPINTKNEYLKRVIEADRPVFGLYSINVTFFGEKNRQDISIESALDVTLGAYNRCPDGTTKADCS